VRNLRQKYPFVDQGKNLRGRALNLTLVWNVMPKVGVRGQGPGPRQPALLGRCCSSAAAPALLLGRCCSGAAAPALLLGQQAAPPPAPACLVG
jgi:hypothetical protein